jgi:hypothetical protein
MVCNAQSCQAAQQEKKDEPQRRKERQELSFKKESNRLSRPYYPGG